MTPDSRHSARGQYRPPTWPWAVPACLLPVAIIGLIAVLNLAEMRGR